MAYCHECGEKIAENDIFCPYCGISLHPMALGGEDISMEQTIVAGPPSISESTENKNFEEKAGNVSAPDGSVSQNDDHSGSVTEENFDQKTESIEIPAAEFENKEMAQDATSGASESAFDDPAPAPETPAPGKDEISQPEFLRQNENAPPVAAPQNIEILKPLEDPPSIDEPQPQMDQIDDAAPEVAENAAPAETESSNPAQSTNSENEKTSDKMPDSSPPEIVFDEPDSAAEAAPPTENAAEQNFNDPEENPNEAPTFIYPSGSFENQELLSAQAPLSDVPAKSADDESNVADSIAKPEVDLEPVPRKSTESVFDSVQIVQRDEPLAAEPAPAENRAPAPESKEARSYTTPNFTGNDTDGKSGSKLKPLDEGTVLNNRYEIVRKIGGGGMGAVYLASDKNLGGVLRAVKEMVQSYIEETQQDKAVADFKRESMLLTSLEHPAIPTIYDYFYDEQEARFYLVMKYISGGDLSSRLRSAPEGKIDEQTITDWAIQIADVLDYLHNRQPPIVYRDLKPANIMIDGNSGRIMLIDFGIARWVNKEEKGVTAVGTMGYAPPELFSGNVESRSDIYSLGSTMFHLLTGADPQSNPLLIFDFQKNPRPRQINSQLSDQMERILMRSVEYNSDKRFASAAEMRQALQEHLDNLKANRVTFGVKEIPQSVALSEQPVFCGFCGQKIVATDMFCAFCGAKQPIAQQGVHNVGGGYRAPSLTAKLMIVGTNELESPSFFLEKDENLVGRRDPMSNIFPEIDLSKYDPQTKISRRHARIWRDGGQFMVEDLGSSNGTILLPVVNETTRLLPHQPHVLSNGDKLKVGDTMMHFVIG